MGSQVIMDYDTVGVKNGSELSNVFDFNVSNPFYLLAPTYYYQLYANYLMPSIALYDGTIKGVYQKGVGFTTQRLLPSISRGLANMLFANGIDFSGDLKAYNFIKKWSKKNKFIKTLRKAFIECCSGGTSLLKINRNYAGDLYVTSHRIDTFFVDIDSSGQIVNAKIFFDAMTNTVKKNDDIHYGMCEERYFNEKGQPCSKVSIYRGSANLRTETLSRIDYVSNSRVDWQQLPSEIKNYVKKNYPSVMLDREILLPFKDFLGCMTMNFTESIPQVPQSVFGQPIGDILQSEALEYDQIKYFERNEVDMARARALVPDAFWNADDEAQNDNTLSDRFYQKIRSMDGENEKITPIQFQLRADQIRIATENIIRNVSLKLGLSASSVASFLNEGAGARTATEIISERTKTDTWIKAQTNMYRDDLNEFLNYITRYYGVIEEISIVFKCEDQAPALDKMKAYSDVYAMGNISPERFVKDVFATLSQEEQKHEIEYLKQIQAQKQSFMQPNIDNKAMNVDNGNVIDNEKNKE